MTVVATKFDDGEIEVQTKVLASKAGPAKEQLVSVKGDKARCPSVRGEESIITSLVGREGTEILRSASFDNLELAVRLTAQ
ncbi:hypothetical protein [Cupriavidus alkaliphilus]|uniref:hypothetical protein n=1 Tax=Cupriavidus alkaliphilus TaxID=942866 RepID=UPI00339DA7CE